MPEHPSGSAARAAVEPVLLTIPAAIAFSGFTRNRIYALAACGHLVPRRAGRRMMIAAAELRGVIDALASGTDLPPVREELRHTIPPAAEPAAGQTGRVWPQYASIDTWMMLSGMSRRTTYELLGSGALRAVKLGRLTRIDVAHGLRYMASLPAAVIRPSRPPERPAA